MKTTVFKKEKIPDLSKYQIVLIGISKYPDKKIKNVPNIDVNISALKTTFRNLNVPKSNITVIQNTGKVRIETELAKIAENKNEADTLILYYAAHSVVSKDTFDPFLATADTRSDAVDATSISYQTLRDIISRANYKQKIVFIDSCFSGTFMSKSSDIDISNDHSEAIILSSASAVASYYPDDKNKPTYFTDALLKALVVPNDKQYITVSDIYSTIKNVLDENNHSLPLKSFVNDIENVPLFVNGKFNGKIKSNIVDVKLKYRKKGILTNIVLIALLVTAFAGLFVLNQKPQTSYIAVPDTVTLNAHRNVVKQYSIPKTVVISYEDQQKIDEYLNIAKNYFNSSVKDLGNKYGRIYLDSVLTIDPTNEEALRLLDSLSVN